MTPNKKMFVNAQIRNANVELRNLKVFHPIVIMQFGDNLFFRITFMRQLMMEIIFLKLNFTFDFLSS